MSMFPKRFVGSTYVNSLLLVSTLLLLMPNSFGVLTSLFITSNIHVYKSDAMHYNDIGSKKIAFSILEDLIYKKHL